MHRTLIAIASLALVHTAAADSFKTWKTIKLGTGTASGPAFADALKAKGVTVTTGGTTNSAEELLGKADFAIAAQPTSVELIRVTPRELGFDKRKPEHDLLYKKAKELGLGACSLEVGPQLRLQYLNQPKGEMLFVGIQKEANYAMNRLSYALSNETKKKPGLYLDGYAPDSQIELDAQWVFCRSADAEAAAAAPETSSDQADREDLVRRYDANQDGKIDKEELRKMSVTDHQTWDRVKRTGQRRPPRR
jgi:hypothetical protein